MEWISVKDRLPEDDERVEKQTKPFAEFCSVIAYGKIKGGEYIVKETNRYMAHKTGNESIDSITLDFDREFEKWYWADCWEEVICYMPLPEPPKEE